ncbi:glycoside hydrolase family 17 protein, partial [Jimgerdemannia flammicorona]
GRPRSCLYEESIIPCYFSFDPFGHHHHRHPATHAMPPTTAPKPNSIWASSLVLWAGGGVALLIVGALAGGLGYYFTRGGGSSSLSSSSNTTSTSPISPNTNTSITLDPRFSRSFWGINYTPLGAQLDMGCGVTQDNVIEDLKILYQLTPRIRLYGMDCRQAEFVLNGLKLLNVSMGVVLTIWVDPNSTTYQRQYDTFFSVIKTYGYDHLIGVSVGNEAIYRNDITVQNLTARIADVRAKITAAGYPEIPVYTTDNQKLDQLIPAEDVLMDNVHPFFAGVTSQQAANWTWTYFWESDQSVANQYGRPALISETGWPTFPANASQQAAVPSVENLQVLLDTFICQANMRNVPYFFFEFMDEPWKAIVFQALVESYWGLFDQNRVLKNITLPQCPLPVFVVGDVKIPQPTPLNMTG